MLERSSYNRVGVNYFQHNFKDQPELGTDCAVFLLILRSTPALVEVLKSIDVLDQTL